VKDRFVTFIKVKEDSWLKIYNESRRQGTTIPKFILSVLDDYFLRKTEEKHLSLKKFNLERYKRIGERLRRTKENLPVNDDYALMDRIGEIIETWSFPNEQQQEEVLQKEPEKDDLFYIKQLYGK
jgi:hypothetical protein